MPTTEVTALPAGQYVPAAPVHGAIAAVPPAQ